MKEKYLIRMPKELKEKLKKEADRKGFSMNGLMVEYLWRGLQEKEK